MLVDEVPRDMKCKGDMFTKQPCSNEVEGWKESTWFDEIIECVTLAPVFGQCRNEFNRYYYEVCLECRTKDTMHLYGFTDKDCCNYCRSVIEEERKIWGLSIFKTE